MGLAIFLGWWYGAGWANSFKAIFNRVSLVAQEFSLPILLRTLFEPWKQLTVYTGPGAPLDAKMRVLFDNLFSRFFGFVVRTMFIFICLIAVTVTFIAGIILAIAWPVIPFLPAVCAVMAVAWL